MYRTTAFVGRKNQKYLINRNCYRIRLFLYLTSPNRFIAKNTTTFCQNVGFTHLSIGPLIHVRLSLLMFLFTTVNVVGHKIYDSIAAPI